jgi:uncharacterized protein
MLKTKQDILRILDQNGSDLRALGVKRIGLFGSFVRGEQRPDSDIDLLVEFDAGRKTFDAFMELSFFLEEVLDHRIELVTAESLSPYLGPHILKEIEYAALAAWISSSHARWDRIPDGRKSQFRETASPLEFVKCVDIMLAWDRKPTYWAKGRRFVSWIPVPRPS